MQSTWKADHHPPLKFKVSLAVARTDSAWLSLGPVAGGCPTLHIQAQALWLPNDILWKLDQVELQVSPLELAERTTRAVRGSLPRGPRKGVEWNLKRHSGHRSEEKEVDIKMTAVPGSWVLPTRRQKAWRQAFPLL